jgi:hypothetical protein
MINELCDLHGITYLLTIEALFNASCYKWWSLQDRRADTKTRLSRMPYAVCRILYPVSRIPYPVSRIPYPVSRIPYPVSRIPYAVSRIPYPKSLPPKAHATYGFHYKHRHILLAHVCSNELISILILATN